MIDTVERLVNLAMLLAATPAPVTAEYIRTEVAGYPPGQDEAAFLRMFERDKDALREAGLVIASTADGLYCLDAGATFAETIDLSPAETITLRTIAGALIGEEAFPFAHSLRYAVAKIVDGSPEIARSTARLIDENPAEQGAVVAAFSQAMTRRKRLRFLYTNARGAGAPHEVEPYGLFLREGRWYAVGRDVARDEVRVYAAVRAREPEISPLQPKTADYDIPAGFSVASYIGLPFQYGQAELYASLRLDGAAASRATALTAGVGDLRPDGDGYLFDVVVRDTGRLLTWIVENGPGISVRQPASLIEDLRRGLVEVEALHG